MFKFLRDLLIFPFDSHKETNKFGSFLRMLFKEYPAFLRIKPNIKKILAFPFIVLFYIFKSKKNSNK